MTVRISTNPMSETQKPNTKGSLRKDKIAHYKEETSEKGQKKTTSNRQNMGKSWKHEVVCVPHMKMQNQGRGGEKLGCSGKKWHDQVFAFYIFILGQQITTLCQTNKPIMSNF